MNPIQSYLHLIESFPCILKTFVVLFWLSMNSLISFGIYSTPKLSKYHVLYHDSHTKRSNEVLLIHTYQYLLHMPDPSFYTAQKMKFSIKGFLS